MALFSRAGDLPPAPERLPRGAGPGGPAGGRLGGWTEYGASHCLREWAVHDENGQAYGAIWDAGPEFYRTTGVGAAQLSFNDQERWIMRRGPNSWGGGPGNRAGSEPASSCS